jgi:hypothetical protein
MILSTVMIMTGHRIKVEIVYTKNKVKKFFDLNTNIRNCTIHRLREATWRGVHLFYVEHVGDNFILGLFVESALHENIMEISILRHVSY